MTDYALELIRKHEERVQLELIRRSEEERQKLEKRQKALLEQCEQDSGTSDSNVQSGASDTEIVAFNDGFLKL